MDNDRLLTSFSGLAAVVLFQVLTFQGILTAIILGAIGAVTGYFAKQLAEACYKGFCKFFKRIFKNESKKGKAGLPS